MSVEHLIVVSASEGDITTVVQRWYKIDVCCLTFVCCCLIPGNRGDGLARGEVSDRATWNSVEQFWSLSFNFKLRSVGGTGDAEKDELFHHFECFDFCC